MTSLLAFPGMLADTGGPAAVEPKSLVTFQTDFPAGGTLPPVRGESVKLRREPHPANAAREFTYWHMVTDGPDELTRVLDLPRLVRMPWAKPLLDHHKHETVKRWWNFRAGRRHFCLWHPPVNYLLVIKERYDGLFLTTTYCPEPKRRLDFHMEWAQAKKAGRIF